MPELGDLVAVDADTLADALAPLLGRHVRVITTANVLESVVLTDVTEQLLVAWHAVVSLTDVEDL